MPKTRKMASSGCDANFPTKSTHQSPETGTYIIPASREYPIQQTFSEGITGDRQAQHMTRSMLIAIEQHRRWHVANESFAIPADLNVHQDLMRSRILLGDDFNTAHQYAVSHGPQIN